MAVYVVPKWRLAMDAYAKIENAALRDADKLLREIAAEKDARRRAVLILRFDDRTLSQPLFRMHAHGVARAATDDRTLAQCLCVANETRTHIFPDSLLGVFRAFFPNASEEFRRQYDPASPFDHAKERVRFASEWAALSDFELVERVTTDAVLAYAIRADGRWRCSRYGLGVVDSRPASIQIAMFDAMASIQHSLEVWASLYVHRALRTGNDDGALALVNAYVMKRGVPLELNAPNPFELFAAVRFTSYDEKLGRLVEHMRHLSAFLAFRTGRGDKSRVGRFTTQDGDGAAARRILKFLV